MSAVTTKGSAVLTFPAEDQMLISREFDAPRHLVYKATTTPELVSRWWSGQRGKVTHAEIDLRVGGTWRYVMEAHGGMEVAVHGEYLELVPDERGVSTEVYEGAPPEAGHTVNTVTFTELEGDRTRLEVLVQCPSRQVRDMIIESGMEGGMQEAYDLLEEVAASLR